MVRGPSQNICLDDHLTVHYEMNNEV
jgi:hypothetical protein